MRYRELEGGDTTGTGDLPPDDWPAAPRDRWWRRLVRGFLVTLTAAWIFLLVLVTTRTCNMIRQVEAGELTWSAVTVDCDGGPEVVAYYLVRTYHVHQVGEEPGPDGAPSPIYSRTMIETATTDTRFPLEDPAPGDGIAWWDPIAVDLAGNRSDSCRP